MAGKRKERVSDDPREWRAALLIGVSLSSAIMLYDNGMAALTERGQASYFAAMQLRDAALWTQDIEAMREEIRLAMRGGQVEADGGRIRTLMRNKATAEKARRDILDALLLTPQRPRGRPRREGEPEEEAEDAYDAWEDFDKPDGGGAG